MYEIKVKIRHECNYLKIANLFDIPIHSYCSELYDLMIIPKCLSKEDEDNISQILIEPSSLEINYGPLDQDTGKPTTTYVYFKCMCGIETSVSPKIAKAGGMVQEPILYQDGYEHYKILALNNKTQSNVLKYLQTLEDYELMGIRDLGRDGIFKLQFITLQEIVENLTDRQIEVITKMYEEGYYEIPRKVTAKGMSGHFDVSRVAIDKSMRKAENAIMSAIMPYLFFHRKINLGNTDNNPIVLASIE